MKRTIGIYSIFFFNLILAIGFAIVVYIKYRSMQDAPLWLLVIVLFAMAFFTSKVARVNDSFIEFFSFVNIFKKSTRINVTEITKVTIYERFARGGWTIMHIRRRDKDVLIVEVNWMKADIKKLKNYFAENQIELE